MAHKNLSAKLSLGLFIAGVLSLIPSFFSSGVSQATWIAIGLTLIGAWLGRLKAEELPKLSSRFVSQILPAMLVLLSFLLGWCVGHPTTPKYPRSDGLIADFTAGAGGAARNACGETFSIILDSDMNENSKCWYQNVCSKDGACFLRIFYQLESDGEHIPYAGVFTDFSHPPSKQFDISQFKILALRVRINQPPAVPPVEVFLGIPTANFVEVGMYDYYEYQIPNHELQSDWIEVEAPLSKFQIPDWSSRGDIPEFDTKHAFRFTIAIKGPKAGVTHGSIEIDDVRFK